MYNHKDGLEDRCKWRGKLCYYSNIWIKGLPSNIFSIENKCEISNSLISCDVLRDTMGQYSGEKDKNEKEIYEGDFVELVLYDGPYDENDNPRRTIVEVVYNKDYHTLMFNPIEDSPCGFMYSINSETCKDCTIVGNKYDNPEIKKYGIKFIKE